MLNNTFLVDQQFSTSRFGQIVSTAALQKRLRVEECCLNAVTTITLYLDKARVRAREHPLVFIDS